MRRLFLYAFLFWISMAFGAFADVTATLEPNRLTFDSGQPAYVWLTLYGEVGDTVRTVQLDLDGDTGPWWYSQEWSPWNPSCAADYKFVNVTVSPVTPAGLPVVLLHWHFPGLGAHTLTLCPGYDGCGSWVYDGFEPLLTHLSASVEITWVAKLGDCNGDGLVNAADIDQFIDALFSGDRTADMNGDGAVNAFDVDGFIEAL